MAIDNSDDPSRRMNKAQALADRGRHPQALEEYLWCFDHGLERDPAFYGVRLSFLLSYVVELGKTHPPALEALRVRRDRAEAAILGSTATPQVAHDYTALNDHLGDERRTLATYDSLGERAPELKGMMIGSIIDLLLEARRYAEILEASDPVMREIDGNVASFQYIRDFVEGRVQVPMDPDLDPDLAREIIAAEGEGLLTQQRREVIVKGGKLHEALLGTSRLDEAVKLADRLIEFHPCGETYARLIGHAIRAGQKAVGRELAIRGKSTLPEAEHAAIDRASSETSE